MSGRESTCRLPGHDNPDVPAGARNGPGTGSPGAVGLARRDRSDALGEVDDRQDHEDQDEDATDAIAHVAGLLVLGAGLGTGPVVYPAVTRGNRRRSQRSTADAVASSGFRASSSWWAVSGYQRSTTTMTTI